MAIFIRTPEKGFAFRMFQDFEIDSLRKNGDYLVDLFIFNY